MDGFNQNNTSHHPASTPTATAPTSTSSSSRRRLTKKPPSSHHQYHQHHQHRSSNSVDASAAGRFDALSIQSKRSSTSLRRAPSAPPARTPTSNASNSSSPRHPPTSSASTAAANHHYHHHHHPQQHSRSLNPSPIIPGGEFSSGLSFSQSPTIGASASAYAFRDPARSKEHYRLSDPHSNNLNHGTGTGASAHHRLNSKASEEFIGAPFDGSAILTSIEATKSPTSSHRPTLSRLAHTTPDARVAGLSKRQSSSFSAAAGNMAASEKSQGFSQSKRFSDESKEPKMSVLRKKSGFSGFMTSLVGSPKKPTISAPENPVHVTHVGYDSSTGQFTVSLHLVAPPLQPLSLLVARLGSPEGPSADFCVHCC